MNKKQENKDKRIEYLKNLIETTGSTKVNCSEVARLFDVNDKTIRNDLQEVYKDMNEKQRDNVSIELVKLDSGLKQGLRVLEKFINSDRGAETKVKAIDTYSHLVGEYISNLTKLGLFRPETKTGNNAPQIICFTQTTVGENTILDYCKKKGYDDVILFYEEGQSKLADAESKARLARDGLIYVKPTVVKSFDDCKEKGVELSFEAVRNFLKADDEPETYLCRHCHNRHKVGDICFESLGHGQKIKSGGL